VPLRDPEPRGPDGHSSPNEARRASISRLAAGWSLYRRRVAHHLS